MTIYERIARIGARLVYDQAVPTSCCGIVDGRVVIRLGRMYTTGDSAVRAYLVEHELAHIVRGDLDVKDVEPSRWNVASDACIAAHLAASHGAPPEGCVTLARLQSMYPGLLDGLTAARARPIYEHLPNDGAAEGCGTQPREMDEADATEAERVRAIAARDAGAVLPSPPRRTARPVHAETRAERVVRRLADRVRATSGGVLRRTRSWARPGRLPCLPGIARRHTAHIAVLVDVSGSMADAHAVTDFLSGVPVEVRWIAWATTAQVVPTAQAVFSADVGGGTLLAPALALARGCDHIVIVSDACLGDAPPAPDCPVTWVVVGDAVPPWGVVA